MLPPPCFTVGMFSGSQTSPFFLQRTTGHVSKNDGLCLYPCLNLQTVIWPFLCWFWSNGFFLTERPFSPCWYRTRFTVDNDTFTSFSHKVFCICSGVDTHIFLQSTFISSTQNPSPSWVIWWLDIPMMFILACNCLNRWQSHLQESGNCTQEWTRLVEAHNSLPEILADLFWFSCDVTEGSLRCGLKYIHRCASK